MSQSRIQSTSVLTFRRHAIICNRRRTDCLKPSRSQNCTKLSARLCSPRPTWSLACGSRHATPIWHRCSEEKHRSGGTSKRMALPCLNGLMLLRAVLQMTLAGEQTRAILGVVPSSTMDASVRTTHAMPIKANRQVCDLTKRSTMLVLMHFCHSIESPL